MQPPFIFMAYTIGNITEQMEIFFWMKDVSARVHKRCLAWTGRYHMDLAALTLYFTKYGAIAIFVIVLLEYLNLPGFPAGIIMPLSGVMAARGNIHFLWVMVITVTAGLTGSLLLYLLGYKGGELFLNAYIRRFPKQKEGLEKNMEWLRKKGPIGVFVAKLLPAIRTIISIPAGVLKMPLRQYIISSTLGICIWNFVFVGAGYLLGDRVFQILGGV